MYLEITVSTFNKICIMSNLFCTLMIFSMVVCTKMKIGCHSKYMVMMGRIPIDMDMIQAMGMLFLLNDFCFAGSFCQIDKSMASYI